MVNNACGCRDEVFFLQLVQLATLPLIHHVTIGRRNNPTPKWKKIIKFGKSPFRRKGPKQKTTLSAASTLIYNIRRTFGKKERDTCCHYMSVGDKPLLVFVMSSRKEVD